MKIGIDLGGSHIAVGLIDDTYNIVLKKEHNWTKEEKKNLIANIEKYSKKIIKELVSEAQVEKLEKIGIGYPNKNIINGIIYLEDGSFNLIEILSKEFDVPVYLKNDVKCSACCEKAIGSLKKYDNCLFITLGTGIGGAYFYKNQLLVPNKYPGLEVGHMIIQVDGKQCRCGQKGCFEEYASMRVFREQIEELFGIQGLTSNKMFEILESKDKEGEVEKIIDRYVKYLSIGICNLINIFETDAICIGGSFSYYASIFIDKLRENIKSNFIKREVPEILIAKYANDAGIIGATMLESN